LVPAGGGEVLVLVLGVMGGGLVTAGDEVACDRDKDLPGIVDEEELDS